VERSGGGLFLNYNGYQRRKALKLLWQGLMLIPFRNLAVYFNSIDLVKMDMNVWVSHFRSNFRYLSVLRLG